MGEAQSGGGVDTDVGGAGQDTGGGRDTSPSTPASLGFGGARGDIVARTPSAPSFGMSPGAMGGRVPDVQPTVMRSFDPGVYSQPVSPSVMAGNPAIPSLATNDAYQANLDFISGIRSLAGGQSPGAMGGRIGDDSPTFSSQPDPSTALPLRVDTQAAPRIRFNPVTNELLRDQTGRVVFDDMSRQPTRTMIAADETGTERQALRMLPINEPMGGGRILPELEADPFAPLGGTGVTPQDVIFQRASRAFDEPDPGGIIGPLQTMYQRGFTPGEDVGALYGRGFTPGQDIGALYGRGFDPTKIASLLQSGKKGTQQEEAQKKTIGQRLQEIGKKISDFTFSDLVDYVGRVLRGDSSFKGTPSSAIDPFAQQGMGPGPFVGGGAPSPSGGGGMPMPAKDPCPPGFRFDPTLQQCVPIIAPNTPTDTTTPPPAPTPPAPTPPAAGGIANAYPFVLTPPIGTPVGNLPPVRLTT
jgi:hypothetical protein